MDIFRLLGDEQSMRKMWGKNIKSFLPFKNLTEEQKNYKNILMEINI